MTRLSTEYYKNDAGMDWGNKIFAMRWEPSIQS